MNKKLYGAIALVVILAGLLVLNHNGKLSPEGKNDIKPMIASTTAPVESAPVANETPQEAKNKAWGVFEAYSQSLASYDINSLKSLSYRLSDTCKDSSKKSECLTIMDNAYEITKDFKESDFNHIWFDNKQIILFSDRSYEESDIAAGYSRNIIYFVRDKDGSPKVLFFTMPKQITYTLKTSDMTKAEAVARLDEMVKDTDQDLVDDEVEKCEFNGATDACVKTDPLVRDTDGNGYWDSIDAIISGNQ